MKLVLGLGTINPDSRLLLAVGVFGRRGTDPAAATLYRLTEQRDFLETVFFVDWYDYPTFLFRLR